MTIVIAGATGYLGRQVVQGLSAAGHRVRALARAPERLGEARGACAEVFVGEALQPATLTGLFDGAEVAFSSIGVRHLHRHPSFWEVDLQGNLNLVEAARAAGVRTFIFVSVFRGAEARHSLALAEARERVVDAICASGMRPVILRPTGFFNDMAEFFQMAERGRVWLLGDGAARLNPIHGADIADAVVRELASEGARELDLGGPDIFSMRELGELAFRTLKRAPRFGNVPPGLVRGLASMVAPFNANAAALARAFLTLATLDGVAPPVGTRHLADFYAELAVRVSGAPSTTDSARTERRA